MFVKLKLKTAVAVCDLHFIFRAGPWKTITMIGQKLFDWTVVRGSDRTISMAR